MQELYLLAVSGYVNWITTRNNIFEATFAKIIVSVYVFVLDVVLL